MKVLSLFAGIGGFDLGLTMAGYEIVAQVEIDEYCNKILAHHFPHAKRYKDIKEVTGEQITRDCGTIELICGGFPCQDISTAGKGAGLDAERSGLWWEMHRLIDELKPRWVIIENVFALRVRGLNRVIAALEALGYKTEHWGIPAAAIGAPHERKRLFIVGYSNSHGCKQRPLSTISRKDLSESNSTSAYVADSDSIAGATGALETGGSMVAAGAISAKPGSDSPMEHSDSNGGQEGLIAGHCHKEIAATGNTSPIPDTDSDGIREQSGGLCRQDWIYSPFAFPVGPGQQQWDWEEPRTIELPLGSFPYGLSIYLLGLVKKYATETSKPIKTVPQLSEYFLSETLRFPLRGSDEIQAEKILLNFLFKHLLAEERGISKKLSPSNQPTIQENILRILRQYASARDSSYRPELQEQYTKELTDTLRQLPRPLALASKKAWLRYSRCCTSRRKLALRALGNAVVPGIIYGIGRAIGRVERAIAQKSL